MEIIDPRYLAQVLPTLLAYLPETLWLSLVSMAAAVLLALPLAVLQIKKVPLLGRGAEAYVLLSRACPLMVQVYVVYFGLPLLLQLLSREGLVTMGADALSPSLVGVVALSLSFAAYIAQILRGALLAVDAGQMEAAQTLGMTWLQGFWRIVLPQALCYALPPLGSQFLNIVKNTSILFVISVQELMAGGILEAAMTYRYLEVYLVVAAIYWCVCFALEKVLDMLSSRFMVYMKG